MSRNISILTNDWHKVATNLIQTGEFDKALDFLKSYGVTMQEATQKCEINFQNSIECYEEWEVERDFWDKDKMIVTKRSGSSGDYSCCEGCCAGLLSVGFMAWCRRKPTVAFLFQIL